MADTGVSWGDVARIFWASRPGREQPRRLRALADQMGAQGKWPAARKLREDASRPPELWGRWLLLTARDAAGVGAFAAGLSLAIPTWARVCLGVTGAVLCTMWVRDMARALRDGGRRP